jgi:hypothetical protein
MVNPRKNPEGDVALSDATTMRYEAMPRRAVICNVRLASEMRSINLHGISMVLLFL